MSKTKSYENITYCIDLDVLEKIREYSILYKVSESRVLNSCIRSGIDYIETQGEK